MTSLTAIGLIVGVIWLASSIGIWERKLMMPLLVGGLLRVGLALSGWHLFPLPYSRSDAVWFERGAWRMAEEGWPAVFEGLNPISGFSYTAPFAAIYAFVGREPHALLAYNGFLSVLTIALVFRIGLSLGGPRVATVSAWAMALFPAAILMSSVVLREAAVSFGVALGLFGLLESERRKSLWFLLVGVAGLGWASLHHGGILFSAVVTLGAFTVAGLRSGIDGARVRPATAFASLGALVILLGTAFALAPGQFRLASVGVINFETIESEVLSDTPRNEVGGSSYYGGTTTESWGQAVRQIPGRVTLFMASPLPWTVRSVTQVAGLVDGMLWVFVLVILVKYRSVIWHDPRARILMLFLAIAVTTYALGTTNAGTALRHRTKLAPALIPLATFAFICGRDWVRDVRRGKARSESHVEPTRVASASPD